MNRLNNCVTSLDQAIDFARNKLGEHPECDIDTARKAAFTGESRRYPVVGIMCHRNPGDFFHDVNKVDLPRVEIPDDFERELTVRLLDGLTTLRSGNGATIGFNVGQGPGTLVTCFGIPLDPEAANSPAYTITVDDVMSMPIPSVERNGVLPKIRDEIRRIKDLTPSTISIGLPDIQGPFNIAHSLVGEEALLLPYTDPEKFKRFMERMTDFWIDSVETLREWIGRERLDTWGRRIRLRECSVNLMSAEMYKEFILPCDLRARDAFDMMGIHTCSGPHVFHVTLENIPNIAYTEAGYVSMAAAGHTDVREALKAIEGRDVLLNIWQEVHDEDHFEFIRQDLDHYAENKHLLFNYTIMDHSGKDRNYLRELRRKIDDYWVERYYPESADVRKAS